MTKQEWDNMQEYYDTHIHSLVTLQVGDYKVSLTKQIGTNNIRHMVYVNEMFKGVWTGIVQEDMPVESQFMCQQPQTYRLYSKAEIEKLRRAYGKKYAEKFAPKKYKIATPYYPSFAAFKKQMIKTELPISIISE